MFGPQIEDTFSFLLQHVHIFIRDELVTFKGVHTPPLNFKPVGKIIREGLWGFMPQRNGFPFLHYITLHYFVIVALMKIIDDYKIFA